MADLGKPFDVPQKPGDEIEIKLAAVKVYRGGALGVIPGTGYARKISSTAYQFLGVNLRTVDNSAGAAGDKVTTYARTGIFAFNQSGLVQSDVGADVFFSDDNTITTTPNSLRAGKLVTLDGDGKAWVAIDTFKPVNAVGASTAAAGTTVADAGALPAGTSQFYPTTGADDTKGVKIHANDQITGRLLFIGNGVSNKILKVYGPSGAVINGAAADAAFSSASGKGVWIFCLSGSGNTWLAG